MDPLHTFLEILSPLYFSLNVDLYSEIPQVFNKVYSTIRFLRFFIKKNFLIDFPANILRFHSKAPILTGFLYNKNKKEII